MTEATARELIDSIRELSTVVRGLTAVLIEDREHGEEADPDTEAKPASQYL